MSDSFYVIIPFFSPAGFIQPLINYFLCVKRLKKQKVNYLTVELAFGDTPHLIPKTEPVIHLRGNSILWQKERLINCGISSLPKHIQYVGWIDGDLLFSSDEWVEMTVEKLKEKNIVQLYKRILHLPEGHSKYLGIHQYLLQSVAWQAETHTNWLLRRANKELSYSSPGFAWAAQRSFFEDIGGIYDRNIIGSGDTFMVDCLFDSFSIHGYAGRFTNEMSKHMTEYIMTVRNAKPKTGYIPIEIHHLFHGDLKNRKYMDRHQLLRQYSFDPINDISLEGEVYEWASDKAEFHDAIRQYFAGRREDD